MKDKWQTTGDQKWANINFCNSLSLRGDVAFIWNKKRNFSNSWGKKFCFLFIISSVERNEPSLLTNKNPIYPSWVALCMFVENGSSEDILKLLCFLFRISDIPLWGELPVLSFELNWPTCKKLKGKQTVRQWSLVLRGVNNIMFMPFYSVLYWVCKVTGKGFIIHSAWRLIKMINVKTNNNLLTHFD